MRCGQYPNGQMAQWLLDMPGPLNNIAGCIWVAWRLWSELSAPPHPPHLPLPLSWALSSSGPHPLVPRIGAFQEGCC